MSQLPHLTIVGHPKPSIICNTLLLTLSADDLALVQPHLEVIALKRGDVIVEPNKPIHHVVFPEDAIISVVASTPDGRRIEVGIIGRDGVTSTSVLHGADTTPHEIFTQVPGSALRMAADDLRTAIRDSRSLHEHLLRYVRRMAQANKARIGLQTRCRNSAPMQGAPHQPVQRAR